MVQGRGAIIVIERGALDPPGLTNRGYDLTQELMAGKHESLRKGIV